MIYAVMSFPNATGQSTMYGNKPNAMLVFILAKKTMKHVSKPSKLLVVFISVFLHL